MRKFNVRPAHIVGLLTGVVLGILMTGCTQKDIGKSLGTAWVVHNSATQTMIGLGEAEVVDVNVLKEFNSYQSPVKEGLDDATEEYLSGDEDQVKLLLDLLGPMLDRMVEMTEESEDE